jgi:hypothetical protein
MKYADIGSISEGTLRSEDLLDTFASELDSLLRKQPRTFKRTAHRKLIREANKLLATFGDTECDSDIASDVVNELQDALGEFAPPYGSFGASDGDGACFGFWVNDPRESGFDGLTVSDTSEVPPDYRGEVLHVNDHGNMSLYVQTAPGKLREIWAVV